MNSKVIKNLALALFLGVIAIGFTACSNDSDVEDVIEDTKDAAEDAADETSDALEEAADEVKDATN